MQTLPGADLAGDGGGRPRRRSVVVIDDEPMFAGLLQIALSGEPDLQCTGVAYDVRSGLDLVARLCPDLVLLDAHVEGVDGDGLNSATRIVSGHPRARIVLLTERVSPEVLRRATDAGVCSLMPKHRSWSELLACLRSAGPGGLVVHPSLLRSAVNESSNPPARLPELSRRERDVLAMMTDGLDARSMAGRLGISVNTCRGYVKAVLRKLNAHSSLEAVAIARKRGLGGPAELGR